MEVFHFLEDIASWMSSLRVKNELKKMSHQRNQRKYGKKKKKAVVLCWLGNGNECQWRHRNLKREKTWKN